MEKKILIVNVNWIGDVLFSTPFIRAIREAYPKGHIACLLHPRCSQMLEGNSRLDEIIIYDEEGAHKTLFGKLRLIRLLRKKGFDAAFILHRSFTKALITALAGIAERIGYATKHRSFLLSDPVEEPTEVMHKVEYFLNIASSAGIEAHERSYEFFIGSSDRIAIGLMLEKEGVDRGVPLVVIAPGGNWDPKRWPKENFARLVDLLVEKFNARVAIVGAAKDAGLAEDIRSMMKNRPIVFCGKTTLKELGALFERSDLVIANDTGPMHIAVSMKAPTIALFGPTSPAITGPYGKGNYRVISRHDECDIPCYDFSCKDNRCMAAIKVDDVLKEAAELLKK